MHGLILFQIFFSLFMSELARTWQPCSGFFTQSTVARFFTYSIVARFFNLSIVASFFTQSTVARFFTQSTVARCFTWSIVARFFNQSIMMFWLAELPRCLVAPKPLLWAHLTITCDWHHNMVQVPTWSLQGSSQLFIDDGIWEVVRNMLMRHLSSSVADVWQCPTFNQQDGDVTVQLSKGRRLDHHMQSSVPLGVYVIGVDDVTGLCFQSVFQ